MIDNKTYLDFIKKSLETETIEAVDTMNKMALEIKSITIDQYLSAARILVAAYLAQRF